MLLLRTNYVHHVTLCWLFLRMIIWYYVWENTMQAAVMKFNCLDPIQGGAQICVTVDNKHDYSAYSPALHIRSTASYIAASTFVVISSAALYF